jgi:hypothetical protein
MPGRILVGYDHSAEAAAGLRRATAMALADRAELTVVHVAVPPSSWAGVGLLAIPLVDDVVSLGEALVRAAVEDMPQDLGVRWHLITGKGATAAISRHRCVIRALRTALDDECHDVLVLGTGVRPGRVARALLRACPERVLTAPSEPPRPGPWTAPSGPVGPRFTRRHRGKAAA